MPEQTPESSPLTVEGQIIESATNGDVETLKRLLDDHPDKLDLKVPPYEASLLFPAAQSGSIESVDFLLTGADR
ncbi:MAG: hypothetical protein ABW318_08365 [Vicinamibacterales bacterium]